MDEKLISLIASVLSIAPEDLEYESTTETVPQWTSLSHWEIIDAIESQYEIEFTMDEATEFKNLGELCEMVRCKCS